MQRYGRGTRGSILGLLGLSWFYVACSHVHDCEETRTCVEPIGFVDAGSFEWGDGGESGAGTSNESDAGASGTTGGGGAKTGAMTNTAGEAGAVTDRGTTDFDPNTLPRIVTVTPSDGAVGVEPETTLTVTFDRPMNEASVLAAYGSEDLPLDALDVSWNAAHSTLTLTPKRPLTLASAQVSDGKTADFPAKRYQFSFSNTAADEHDRTLEAVGFHFDTLREVSRELDADLARTGNWTDGEGEGIHNCLRHPSSGYEPTVCVGDDSANVRYVGFVSFDLSVLPDEVRAFSSAHLIANGIVNGELSNLGASRLEHLAFDELGGAALNLPPGANLGAFLGSKAPARGSELTLSLDVTSAITSDYGSIEAAKRTQYRLSFTSVSANGIWDDIELRTSSVRLALTYSTP